MNCCVCGDRFADFDLFLEAHRTVLSGKGVTAVTAVETAGYMHMWHVKEFRWGDV